MLTEPPPQNPATPPRHLFGAWRPFGTGMPAAGDVPFPLNGALWMAKFQAPVNGVAPATLYAVPLPPTQSAALSGLIKSGGPPLNTLRACAPYLEHVGEFAELLDGRVPELSEGAHGVLHAVGVVAKASAFLDAGARALQDGKPLTIAEALVAFGDMTLSGLRLGGVNAPWHLDVVLGVGQMTIKCWKQAAEKKPDAPGSRPARAPVVVTPPAVLEFHRTPDGLHAPLRDWYGACSPALARVPLSDRILSGPPEVMARLRAAKKQAGA